MNSRRSTLFLISKDVSLQSLKHFNLCLSQFFVFVLLCRYVFFTVPRLHTSRLPAIEFATTYKSLRRPPTAQKRLRERALVQADSKAGAVLQLCGQQCHSFYVHHMPILNPSLPLPKIKDKKDRQNKIAFSKPMIEMELHREGRYFFYSK